MPPLNGKPVFEFIDLTIENFANPHPTSATASSPGSGHDIIGNLRFLKTQLAAALDNTKLQHAQTLITNDDNVAMVVSHFLDGRADVQQCVERIRVLFAE